MKPYLKTKREKSTTTKGHYVRNADLLPAVVEAKELGHITNKLIVMIQMIADRYSRKGNFVGYSFREDMVSSAVENLVKNALKFNCEKYTNPFAFYTTAIHNSFLQFIADEKKHRNIRDALLIDAGSNPSYNFMQGEKDETDFEVKESDEHSCKEPLYKLDEDETLVKPEVPEEKLRYKDHAPGKVTRYGPGDFIIDPQTGAFILKSKEDIDGVQ